MLNLLSMIPGKKKRTSKGWVGFNAICCHHRGHRPDKRMRGGIISDGRSQTYHCFNCDFSTRLVLGKPLSKKTKQLLKWAGLDDDEINKWNLESLKQKDIFDLIPEFHNKQVKFNHVPLPKNAMLLDKNNLAHKAYKDFLWKRGYSPDDYPCYVTPNDKNPRNKNRIIFPIKYENKNIGYISRYTDNKSPKYLKENQPGALFGYDLQKPQYEVALVFEGVLDAIAFNGCALMHDDISDEQAILLRNLNRKIIVVPDQDKTGMNVIDKALELGFYVSLPDWSPTVKDANDAIIKYGKIPTLLSILQNATRNKIVIKMKREKLAKSI